MTNIFKAIAVLFFAGMTAGGSTEVEAQRLSQVSLTGLKKPMGMMERTRATVTRKRLEKAATELDVFVAEGRKRLEKAATELDVFVAEGRKRFEKAAADLDLSIEISCTVTSGLRYRRKMSIQTSRNLRISRFYRRKRILQLKNLRNLQLNIQFRRSQAAAILRGIKNVQAFEKKAVERAAALERKAAGLEMNAVTGELERVIAEAERQQQQIGKMRKNIDSILENLEEEEQLGNEAAFDEFLGELYDVGAFKLAEAFIHIRCEFQLAGALK